jgi:spore germination protein KC
MKKLAIISALLLIIITLSSCDQIAQGRTEIDKLFITRILSIDEAAEGKVKLTLTTKSLSIGGGQEQEQKGESIVSEGDTVLEAARNLLVYSDRKPHYGHTEYILFGESIAKKGILPYLDFISRQNEFRYNAKIYIVKGDTADSLVKKTNTSKMFIGDRISSIEENIHTTSLSSIITLNETLTILDNKSLDTFIPYIEVTDTMTSEAKQDKFDVLLRGYAIFLRDKLSYFTSREEARGINWMMNRIGSGIIIVKSKKGEEASMEIVDSKVKIKPEIDGDELHCTVNVSFTTNIGEIMGTKSLIDKESIEYLTEQQNKSIKKEIENAVELAQKNNSDHFSIVTKFILKYPMMRDYLNTNWEDLFPDVKFDIKVESNIKGTYLLNDPTQSPKKGAGE